MWHSVLSKLILSGRPVVLPPRRMSSVQETFDYHPSSTPKRASVTTDKGCPCPCALKAQLHLRSRKTVRMARLLLHSIGLVEVSAVRGVRIGEHEARERRKARGTTTHKRIGRMLLIDFIFGGRRAVDHLEQSCIALRVSGTAGYNIPKYSLW